MPSVPHTPLRLSRQAWPSRIRAIVLIGSIGLSTGCMFNIVSVHQVPVQFSTMTAEPRHFVLGHAIDVSIGTGFRTHLRSGTTWVQSGQIAQGDVFQTHDQVVTVEASNIYEAQLVVSGAKIVGFYLSVERTFVQASTDYPLELQFPSGNPAQ